MARRTATACAALLLIGAIVATVPPAGAQDPAAEVAALVAQAEDAGAKGLVPGAWRQFQEDYEQARGGAANLEIWADLKIRARRLANMAAFLQEMRRQKNAQEALLARFDQALLQIAAVYGVAADPALSGSALANSLLADLSTDRLRRQTLADSLAVANRYLTEVVGGQAAAQESLITSLQVEVSALRRKLWETELRAGVAEADRSAAETVLTRKQEREAAVRDIRASLGEKEGEILLTPEGQVVLRCHGIAFAVGQGDLKPGQEALVAKLAEAVAKFPGAQVRVDGHTDDTGSRDVNLRLSLRRAETVARLLEARLKWAKGSIATGGYGPDRPVALNSTAEGRALNRRIDLLITPAP